MNHSMQRTCDMLGFYIVQHRSMMNLLNDDCAIFCKRFERAPKPRKEKESVKICCSILCNKFKGKRCFFKSKLWGELDEWYKDVILEGIRTYGNLIAVLPSQQRSVTFDSNVYEAMTTALSVVLIIVGTTNIDRKSFLLSCNVLSVPNPVLDFLYVSCAELVSDTKPTSTKTARETEREIVTDVKGDMKKVPTAKCATDEISNLKPEAGREYSTVLMELFKLKTFVHCFDRIHPDIENLQWFIGSEYQHNLRAIRALFASALSAADRIWCYTSNGFTRQVLHLVIKKYSLENICVSSKREEISYSGKYANMFIEFHDHASRISVGDLTHFATLSKAFDLRSSAVYLHVVPFDHSHFVQTDAQSVVIHNLYVHNDDPDTNEIQDKVYAGACVLDERFGSRRIADRFLENLRTSVDVHSYIRHIDPNPLCGFWNPNAYAAFEFVMLQRCLCAIVTEVRCKQKFVVEDTHIHELKWRLRWNVKQTLCKFLKKDWAEMEALVHAERGIEFNCKTTVYIATIFILMYFHNENATKK